MMPRQNKGWKKRGRTNRGWFRPGPDPRRHVLTLEEKKFGGEVYGWLYTHFPVGYQWGNAERFFARLQVGGVEPGPQKKPDRKYKSIFQRKGK